jgi:hypothetical protein
MPSFELPQDWSDLSKVPLLRLGAIASATPGELPPQFGLIGRCYKHNNPIGLNLNGCLAMGLFGDNRSGKSYVLGSILEMALAQHTAISRILRPFCSVFLHYHQNASYQPELLTSTHGNDEPRELSRLLHQYRALPQGLRDVVLFTLPQKVDELRTLFPWVQVHALRFALRELSGDGLRELLGIDHDAMPLYARRLSQLVRKLAGMGQALTFKRLLHEVLLLDLEPMVRKNLILRLQLVRPWIDDRRGVRRFIKPGRLLIVDIRDEWLNRDQALLLSTLATTALILHPNQRKEDACPLLLAIDEAHKFANHPPMAQLIENLVRERRHLRLSLILASQDPGSLPPRILPLLDTIGVLRMPSTEWLKDLAKHIGALRKLKPEHTENLPTGTLWFWAKEWLIIDEDLLDYETVREGPLLIEARPRIARHGGATRLAVTDPLSMAP